MKDSRRIITFSRRSDPAPYTPWLQNRLRDGFCDIPNPYSGKLYRVSLLPRDVALFTFWTKNPEPLVDTVKMMLSRSFKVAIFLTVTGYPPHIEQNVPAASSLRDSICALADLLGPEALWWRYDPVLFSRKMTGDWHRRNFESLCRMWSGKTKRVIFSLAHVDGPYKSIRASLERAVRTDEDQLELAPFSSSEYGALYEKTISLFADLAMIAETYGIPSAEVCCSPKLRADETRIRQGRCLDYERILGLVPDLAEVPLSPTRKGVSMSGHGYADCGCVKSTDIGIRGTCPHGCVYCYANRQGMDKNAAAMLSRAL
jgi:hypothetical protein